MGKICYLHLRYCKFDSRACST
eukprot:SAG31_NODE_2753_length_5141_cov_3.640619_11_plen_21_part_01